MSDIKRVSQLREDENDPKDLLSHFNKDIQPIIRWLVQPNLFTWSTIREVVYTLPRHSNINDHVIDAVYEYLKPSTRDFMLTLVDGESPNWDLFYAARLECSQLFACGFVQVNEDGKSWKMPKEVFKKLKMHNTFLKGGKE